MQFILMPYGSVLRFASTSLENFRKNCPWNEQDTIWRIVEIITIVVVIIMIIIVKFKFSFRSEHLTSNCFENHYLVTL